MQPDDAQRAKIMERLRALLSMTTANGCSEAEAMTAASKAAKLMEEYDLAIGDLQSIKDERIARHSKPAAATDRPNELHAAGLYAATAIAGFFDCKCWRNGTSITFFGFADDVELAHAMLAMVKLAMDGEVARYMRTEGVAAGEHPRTLASSFGRGMAHRLSQRLEALKAARTANVRTKGTQLVVVKNALVDAALAQLFDLNLTKPRRRPSPKSTLAYTAGIVAGDRVALGQDRGLEKPAATTQSHGFAPASQHAGQSTHERNQEPGWDSFAAGRSMPPSRLPRGQLGRRFMAGVAHLINSLDKLWHPNRSA